MKILALAAAALLFAGQSAFACYEDGDAPILTGRLISMQPAMASASGASSATEPYYVLELDAPVCIKGEYSNRIARDIRSVHVFAVERAKEADLKRNAGKRVSVAFMTVFEEYNSLHRRPMVGSIRTIKQL